MSLKYTDKVAISRRKELDDYREEIIRILEDSKQLALNCDNLVKMRALKSRCDKISKPRSSAIYDEGKKTDLKRRYEMNKDSISQRRKQKSSKIREVGKIDIGNFFNGVPS